MHIMQAAVNANAGKLMIAKDSEGVAHGAVFFLYDERTCFYLMSGQNPTFKSDGSQNLLLINGLDFTAGVSRDFDYEGSMVEVIENFFRQFGGTQVINYHITKKSFIREIYGILSPKIKEFIR